jgi:hypothetical protein
MKYLFYTLILTIISICNAYSQRYHNSNVVLTNGDTINKVNSNKMYDGFHIITDNNKNAASDSNHYYAGFFKNGVPYGKWIEHNIDGSFSSGEYEVSCETFYDDSLKSNVTLKQGIGAKKGVWSYYGNDSVLTNKILHDVTTTKKITVYKESIELDSGNYQIIKFEKIKQNKWCSKLNTRLEEKYSKNGTLIYRQRDDLFRNKTIEYRSNGIIKSLYKYSNITDREVEIKYNRKGKKHKKIVIKYWNSNIEGCPKFN